MKLFRPSAGCVAAHGTCRGVNVAPKDIRHAVLRPLLLLTMVPNTRESAAGVPCKCEAVLTPVLGHCPAQAPVVERPAVVEAPVRKAEEEGEEGEVPGERAREEGEEAPGQGEGV